MTASPQRVRISKRTVDALKPSGSDRETLWDKDLKGFGVRITEQGRKTYVVKCRVNGRQRWYTIGEHGSPWTPEKAREQAEAVLREAAVGRDAQAEKLKRRADVTVAELIDLYLTEGPATKPDKRASSWVTDKSNLERHLLPLLGRRPARQVTQNDMARAVTAIIEGKTAADIKTGKQGRAIIRGGEATAERVARAAGAMFVWAQHEGMVDTIPTKGVKLPKRRAKERFLSGSEVARLLEVLARLEGERKINASHADALRLLLFTGARKSEILGLRWDEVDGERSRLVLPPERTKAGGSNGDRRIALSPPALEILVALKQRSKFVFPSADDPRKPVVGLQKTWEKVRHAAGLETVRIHDLRHTFASFAIAQGASLPLIGKALGHSSARVTERYAHLADDPVNALVDLVGKQFA